ncbi:hemagglutinin repeat-containing protein [Paludibacterium purpuratum]|uniref:S-PFT family hemolysin n=1 Tax=Paludibacterium purpuratum TaxID=1144873 RepID=A0A4R7B9U3_9NEIS|nr:hemagglutinin repeat-containing protein [Paludibacterium purpuratum]TDR81618.1 S-PFT family hemolysin [Paludibacterium purpuratum]
MNHRHIERAFSLSGAGKVSVAIALAFLLGEASMAAGIVSAGGANGPAVSTQPNGAQVVNIVAPSAAGLSHNQFTDYNVDRFGAVLNNSTAAGQSTLAGQLGANAALGGRAASVILGEVVSRNPSLLLGQQEIFGTSAAFVLANPNGITCNGCGFINTTRASLVVGTPTIANGQLTGVRTAGTASLTIGASGIGGADVLDLIAPRIDARALVKGGSAIRAIAGSNDVGYDDLKVTARQEGAPSSFDSVFLGGMQAGRITVLNTAQGAGVNMGGKIAADDSVSLTSAGRLDLAAVQLKAGGNASLSGASVNVHGALVHDESHDASQSKSWFIWQTGETDHKTDRVSDTLQTGRIDAAQLTIHADGEARLSATEVKANQASIDATSITLATERGTVALSDSLSQWKNSWSHQQTTQSRDETVAGAQFDVKQDLTLNANGPLSAEAATLNAGGKIALTSRADLRLTGTQEAHDSLVSSSRKNEGAALETGSWHNETHAGVLKTTTIHAGSDLTVSADGDLNAQGASMTSGGNADVGALRAMTLGLLRNDTSSQSQDSKTWWGGIGGGARNDQSASASTVVGSSLNAAGGIHLAAGDDLQITASQIHGGAGAHAGSLRGSVYIDGAQSTNTASQDTRKGGVFNITTAANRQTSSTGQQVGASVRSDVDLTIDSANDLRIAGSQVAAKGNANLSAGNNLAVSTQTINSASNQTQTTLGWTGQAASTGDMQYRAGFGLQQVTTTDSRQSDTQAASQLSGGSLQVKAGSDLTLTGSTLGAGNGGLQLSGDRVSLNAADNNVSTTHGQTTSGGGLYVNAGVDTVGGGITFGSDSKQQATQTQSAQVNQLQSGGDLRIGAGTLNNQGSQIGAAGNLTVSAGAIAQTAALSTSNSQSSETQWHADIGAGLQVGDIAHPVVDKLTGLLKGQPLGDDKVGQALSGAATAVKNGDFKGAVDSLKGLGTPGISGQIVASGQHDQAQSSTSSATVASMSGASIAVKSDGLLTDQGGQYTASQGQVSLTAGQLQLGAAQNSSTASQQHGSGSASVSAATVTGADLSLGVKAAGSQSASQDSSNQTLGSQIKGAGGVSINVTGDASLTAASLNGGNGAVNLTSGGNLTLAAGSDRSQHQDSQSGGNGSLNLSMTTAGAVLGGGGSLGVNGGQNASDKQSAVGGSVNGQNVSLQAAQNLSLADQQIKGDQVALGATGGRLDIGGQSQSSSQTGQSVALNLNASGLQTGSGQGGGEIKVDRSTANTADQQGSQIAAGSLSLQSQGDTAISGSTVNSSSLSGNIGGKLTVGSTLSSNDSSHLAVDVSVNGHYPAATTPAAPATPDTQPAPAKSGWDQAIQTVEQLATDPANLIGVHVDSSEQQHQAADHPAALVASQSANLAVTGGSTVIGASLTLPAGSTLSGPVTSSPLAGSDSRHATQVDLSANPADAVKQAIASLQAGKVPFVSTSGSDKDLTVPSTVSR